MVVKTQCLILRLPCGTFAEFKAVHPNRKLVQPFHVVFGFDENMCKNECIHHPKCKSINVNKKESVCELNELSAEDPSDKVETRLQLGWTYYSTFYNETLVSESASG